MKLLNGKLRSKDEAVAVHEAIPVRVYADDPIQQDRIMRTRAAVELALERLNIPVSQARIVELCCGTGDISGYFSMLGAKVTGIDVSDKALLTAADRFPDMNLIHKSVYDVEPIECDVLVMCETLEHVPDPISLVEAWMPKAKASVISHPLNEPLDSDISAGEHMWSFSGLDYDNWFVYGKHALIHKRVFIMGLYNILLGVGINNGQSY